MKGRLNIAFVWHMHQPVYRDPLTERYILPWVLLHATKDYCDMVTILGDFPEIHQTFNLVPCLMEQIEDYGSGKAVDEYREVSKKAARDLDDGEKEFLLSNFFNASRENMILPVKRYDELLRKRGYGDEAVRHARGYFTTQDFLDLQVLFNLVWIDPVHIEADPFLKALKEKGRNYSEEEKIGLLDRQIEIAGRVLPTYREYMEAGQIEVSTSPYFHPILPVVYDAESARESTPDITLPARRIHFPEDARTQLQMGADLYEKVFGRRPRGLWPSEGSVSMEIMPLVREAGFEWVATDEEILAVSTGRHMRRDEHGNPLDSFLYRPYGLETTRGRLGLVFRDHLLSDLIGFDYAKMDPERAASDLISRLDHIHGMLDNPEEHLVSIILDGENAWESYRSDGRDFLLALYSGLSNRKNLKCVTVSEFLSGRATDYLERVVAGSWINHNFRIWIGHPEDNRGWELLHDTRKALIESGLEGDGQDRAWREIYTAEGSDWFWWYGEEHSSANDEQFDALFRRHLKKVYLLIDREPPVELDIPISTREKAFSPVSEPVAYINPVIDGRVTNYFEWLSAGRIEHLFHGAAMHREVHTECLIEGIAYGFSKKDIFFRFDYSRERVPYEDEWQFMITFLEPLAVRISGWVRGQECRADILKRAPEDGRWRKMAPLKRIASGRVLELAVSLETIGAGPGTELKTVIYVDGRRLGTERWPMKGYLVLSVPGEDFEEENWFV